MKRQLLALALGAALVASLAACGDGGEAPTTAAPGGSASASADGAKGQVYYLNFKPEIADKYAAIAQEYTQKTGVPVKVVTAAAGTYEQTLRSEIAKSDAPTIFQINGPVGYQNWKDYTADLKDSELYKALSDKSLAISDPGGSVYGIPYVVEGYGIIYNDAIMKAYFALPDKASSLSSAADIKSFADLKTVAEDMQAKKDKLGIKGAFASTSLKKGEDWRWQTHLANIPLYYEWSTNKVDLTKGTPDSITFQFAPQYQAIMDLYMSNSTVDKGLLGAKSVSDSMAEFALGQAAMVQNGNWAWSQVADVKGNKVQEADIKFMPIYIGAPDEAKQGLAIGTENFFSINSKAKPEDQKASLDFLYWLYSSPEGKKHVVDDLGFIAPFSTFSATEVPSDPLGKQVKEWSARTDIQNVPWNFSVMPNQTWKDDLGAALLAYSQGKEDWSKVTSDAVADWATQAAAAKSGQ